MYINLAVIHSHVSKKEMALQFKVSDKTKLNSRR